MPAACFPAPHTPLPAPPAMESVVNITIGSFLTITRLQLDANNGTALYGLRGFKISGPQPRISQVGVRCAIVHTQHSIGALRNRYPSWVLALMASSLRRAKCRTGNTSHPPTMVATGSAHVVRMALPSAISLPPQTKETGFASRVWHGTTRLLAQPSVILVVAFCLIFRLNTTHWTVSGFVVATCQRPK